MFEQPRMKIPLSVIEVTKPANLPGGTQRNIINTNLLQTDSRQRLYPKKDLFAVHEIEEQPFDHHVANCHHYGIPGIPNPLTQPFEEPVCCVFPVNEMTRH